jgi:Mrp family chromosome partitioning ATPase
MPSPDRAGAELVVRPGVPDARDGDRVRLVPVWASPPDPATLVMLGSGRPEARAALRVIRHRLERLRGEGLWTFGVTSARPAEGKSTFAAQLALVLSEAQRARVLIVEASPERPSLARMFGFEVPSGLGFSVQIAAKMSGIEGQWTVLALGPSLHALVENTAEPGFPGALNAAPFRRAVEQLARSYDWVIVDAPSVLGSGDANVVEESVDGMILVARSRRSRGSELRAALRQIGNRKVIGVVLWDVRAAAVPP